MLHNDKPVSRTLCPEAETLRRSSILDFFTLLSLLAMVGCSIESNTANGSKGIQSSDSLDFTSTNKSGDTVHFWLFHDTTFSTSATKVYSSADLSSIAYKSNENPDAMLFETRNPDGTTWSKTSEA